MSTLASEYMLAEVGLQPEDVVIDIGANIGEVSKFVCETYRAKAIGIEPDQKEFQCLLRNTSHERYLALNLALWAESGEKEIFFKNNTSDTSLIEPRDFERKSTISVFSLDDVMARDDVSNFVDGAVIKLIKLEAEGAEPEILRGAVKTLARTRFISVDCGPERGINEETTVVEVIRLLHTKGYSIVGYFAKRSILLFKNDKISN
ncbi:MAG: FkbM family methyltransferase [Desulforhopalus sp.]|nr:FkbM family methyltransferase [Desulforhopalus sp.]